MDSIWKELRRRNVFRVGVAYLAASWLLLQVVDLVIPILDAPEWLLRVLFFSALLGFPLALALAWFYEVTPEGIKVTSEVPETTPVKFTGRKIDFVIIALLVLAVGFLLVRPPAETERTVLPYSVAVLPFENLSPDPDNAYFAAGIHEELLNQLVKLSKLSVISRTSMMRYRNSDLSIPEIAAELNVETVMEGSVRYAEGRVLVTAQLIDAETDLHIWSDSYNREFADVFEIQADIAMNIANGLEAAFTPEEQARIEAIPTDSPEAYALFLRAAAPGNTPELERKRLLTEAIALDPEFGRAYARRAFHWNTLRLFALQFPERASMKAGELERYAREDAARALEIGSDPLADGVLGWIEWISGNLDLAEEHFLRSIELEPGNNLLLTGYGQFLDWTNRHEEAVPFHIRHAELDPRSGGTGPAYLAAGDIESANAFYRRSVDDDPGNGGSRLGLGLTEILRDDFVAAETELDLAERLLGSQMGFSAKTILAYLYSRIGRSDDARRLAEEVFNTDSVLGLGDLVFASLAINDRAGVRAAFELRPNRTNRDFFIKLNMYSDPVLNEPEFVQLREALTLVEEGN